MLRPVEDQRYLLTYGRNRKKPVEYFCMPRIFSGTKEKAENYQKDMEPYIGKYRLVYTRKPEGRRLLLRGRAVAFSNRQPCLRQETGLCGRRQKRLFLWLAARRNQNRRRVYRRKTVKGALE